MSDAAWAAQHKVFEDFGWFCVDNLPIALLDDFARLVVKSPAMTRVALGINHSTCIEQAANCLPIPGSE